VVIPSQCRHCEDAPCIAACPEGAIAREGDDAPVLISEAKCKGIGACVAACQFEAIRLVAVADARAAVKCDLCVGLDGPACVGACPTSALSLVDRDEARFEIDAEACRACMRCKKACPVDAIEGAKKTPHVIDQAKCMLCGRCFQACPFGAVALTVAEKVG
jgi:Fe-S-cluster-containing hydrogenase component 2